jgi:phage/plasmid-associated DNA primase
LIAFRFGWGRGGNGKGVSKIAFKRAFGTYFYEENGDMFASRSVGSSSSAYYNLAKLEAKRVCMQSECESGDKLRIGLLKQCSCKDTVSARALYQDSGSFECTVTRPL